MSPHRSEHRRSKSAAVASATPINRLRARQLLATVRYEPGAALDAHIEDYAAANHLTLGQFARTIGLIDERSRFPRFWGAVISDRHRTLLYDVLGIDAAAMTLHRYDGTAVDLTGLDIDQPTSMRKAMRRRWLHLAGSRYCPACLRDDRPWQIEWKLPWSFACTRHRTWLHDACPNCRRRPRTYTDKSTNQPAFTSIVPHYTYCPNKRRAGTTRPGRASTPCRHDLARVTTIRCPSGIVGAQREVRRWINTSRGQIFGAQHTAADAFHTLQAACVWLDHAQNDRTGQRPWTTPPMSAQNIGTRTARALVAFGSGGIDDAAEQLSLPLRALLTSTPSARNVLRERTGRNDLTDELADHIARRYERSSTIQRRRATQLLLALDDTSIEDLIENIDRTINYAALRQLTGVDNAVPVLRDAVIIDAALGVGARTAAHAADLADLEPGAVKRLAYVRNLVNRKGNRDQWIMAVQQLGQVEVPTDMKGAMQ